MLELTIEDIRENFNFENSEQYNSFNQMAQDILMQELMEEINSDNEN